MHLIRYLSTSDENRLTVIEKKQERCKEASANSDATILNADGSKTDVLKLAEASQADIVIVTTDDDRVNLAATRLAKKEFGVPRIIAVANSPNNKERLREAGADMVSCPADLAFKDPENILWKARAVTLMYRSHLD